MNLLYRKRPRGLTKAVSGVWNFGTISKASVALVLKAWPLGRNSHHRTTGTGPGSAIEVNRTAIEVNFQFHFFPQDLAQQDLVRPGRGSRRTSFVPHWFGAAEIFLTLVREAPSELRKTYGIEHGPLSMAWLPLSLGQSIMSLPPPHRSSGQACCAYTGEAGEGITGLSLGLPPTCLPPSLHILLFQFHRRFWKLVLFSTMELFWGYPCAYKKAPTTHCMWLIAWTWMGIFSLACHQSLWSHWCHLPKKK